MLSLVEIVSLTYRSGLSVVKGCHFLVHINTCPSWLLCCGGKILTNWQSWYNLQSIIRTAARLQTGAWCRKWGRDHIKMLFSGPADVLEPGTICPAVRHTRWLVPPTSIINLKTATQTWHAHRSKLMEAIPQWDSLLSGESSLYQGEKNCLTVTFV